MKGHFSGRQIINPIRQSSSAPRVAQVIKNIKGTSWGRVTNHSEEQGPHPLLGSLWLTAGLAGWGETR